MAHRSILVPHIFPQPPGLGLGLVEHFLSRAPLILKKYSVLTYPIPLPLDRAEASQKNTHVAASGCSQGASIIMETLQIVHPPLARWGHLDTTHQTKHRPHKPTVVLAGR